MKTKKKLAMMGGLVAVALLLVGGAAYAMGDLHGPPPPACPTDCHGSYGNGVGFNGGGLHGVDRGGGKWGGGVKLEGLTLAGGQLVQP